MTCGDVSPKSSTFSRSALVAAASSVRGKKDPRQKSSVIDATLCVDIHATRLALYETIAHANATQALPSFASGDHASSADPAVIAQCAIDTALALHRSPLEAALGTCRPCSTCSLALDSASLAIKCLCDTFTSYQDVPSAIAAGVAALLAKGPPRAQRHQRLPVECPGRDRQHMHPSVVQDDERRLR